jgi:ABC-type multidrug transport system ATPase subunit
VTAFDFDSVQAAGVSRHFGRRRVLTRVSLECARGTILGLLGPNGSGKSTLLSILATLLAPSDGVVRYGTSTASTAGVDIRHRIGWLGHEVQLYPELTAAENLLFFARLQGVDDARGRVERGLAGARLADRRDDLLSGFSRGMRQRLALERALLHDPRLLLLDEPFTGLDRASAAALVERLRTLAAGGRIVVLATHDLHLIEGLLDQIVILREGRVAAAYEDGRNVASRYAAADVLEPRA